MNTVTFRRHQKSAMMRVNLFLSKNLKELPRKQNLKIREFARLNSLTIPTNKGILDWLIELYLSGENEHCSQVVAIEKFKKLHIKYKNNSPYDDEVLESARVLDLMLESGESKYIKFNFVKAYLLFYRGYMESDLENINMYVHSDDLKKFINGTDVNHAKYLKSLKWSQIKEYVRERDNYTCCQCGRNMSDDLFNLHTHHLTYDRLGNEDPATDLVLMCRKCHTKEHAK